LTRRIFEEEIICDRCGKRETVEGSFEHDFTSQTVMTKLFPVWKYRKPEGWITVGDLICPLGASDYCSECAKKLEELLGKFYNMKG
jgi:hypothetical protein